MTGRARGRGHPGPARRDHGRAGRARAEVVARLPAPAADDFAPENLIEISTAVERFNRPARPHSRGGGALVTAGAGLAHGGKVAVHRPRVRGLDGANSPVEKIDLAGRELRNK